MTHHDDRVSSAHEPTASSEPVNSTPTGRLTCEVRVLSVHEEEK